MRPHTKFLLLLSLLALNPAYAGQTAPTPLNVQIFAHRGASALFPEHTLAAYAKAISDGADFIESDLVMSRDGILLVRHENDITDTTDVALHPQFSARKTVKTIDGKRIEGWFSEDFTLAELKTLRARERLPELRGNRWDGQFQLLTLDEVIDFVAAESAARSRTIGLAPEIKHPSYFKSIGLAMEDKLLTSLQAHQYSQRAPVVVQCFESSSLRYLHGKITRDSNISLLQLLSSARTPLPDAPTRRYAELLTPAGLREIAGYAEAIGPEIRNIIPLTADKRLGTPTSLVAQAHAAGLQVHPYTFRPENHFLAADFAQRGGPQSQRNDAGSAAEIRAYLEQGIDGFFTDDPALGRQAVDGHER